MKTRDSLDFFPLLMNVLATSVAVGGCFQYMGAPTCPRKEEGVGGGYYDYYVYDDTIIMSTRGFLCDKVQVMDRFLGLESTRTKQAITPNPTLA